MQTLAYLYPLSLFLPSFVGCQNPSFADDDDPCDRAPGNLCDAADGGFESTHCVENGERRPIDRMGIGDLVISEVMADPSVVADADGEWFEITALTTTDINGLQVGTSPDTFRPTAAGTDCIRVSAGEQILLARSPQSERNGGLPPVHGTFSFSLANDDGSIALGFEGRLIDQVAWDGTETGVSRALDAGTTTAAANDEEQNWCAATSRFGAGDRGTPGLQNGTCHPQARCLDSDNRSRDVVAPRPADVRISEIMADPTAVTDADGEWFEVLFADSTDLNGVQVGRAFEPDLEIEFTIDDDQCIPIAAGTRVIFSRHVNPLVNGGLPTTHIFDANVALSQRREETLPLFVAVNNDLLATVAYRGDDVIPGRSLIVEDDGTTCAATSSYNQMDRGTPGDDDDRCELQADIR